MCRCNFAENSIPFCSTLKGHYRMHKIGIFDEGSGKMYSLNDILHNTYSIEVDNKKFGTLYITLSYTIGAPLPKLTSTNGHL